MASAYPAADKWRSHVQPSRPRAFTSVAHPRNLTRHEQRTSETNEQKSSNNPNSENLLTDLTQAFQQTGGGLQEPSILGSTGARLPSRTLDTLRMRSWGVGVEAASVVVRANGTAASSDSRCPKTEPKGLSAKTGADWFMPIDVDRSSDRRTGLASSRGVDRGSLSLTLPLC
ncbi:hypothetical protein NL676_035056 [Syzygium grande]|nr:hypothetical protein NL676_035056 [Syzygium grande]